MSQIQEEQSSPEARTRQRIVFYANNEPESLEIMDRFNIYYVTARKHKSKSDALKHLLKIALDVEEKEGGNTKIKTK